MKNIRERILMNLIGLAFCMAALFLFGCSPQKRLNRLIENNPELVKTDTIFATSYADVSPVTKDTSIAASTDTSGLSAIIARYESKIDSLTRESLKTSFVGFMATKKCLSDTFTVRLKNNGYVNIWQHGDRFKFSMYEPAQRIPVVHPVKITKIEPRIIEDKQRWKYFWIGFSVMPCLVLILIVISKIFKP